MDPSHDGSPPRRLPPPSLVLVGLAVLLLVLWPRLRPADPQVPDPRPRAVIAPSGDANPGTAAPSSPQQRAKVRSRSPAPHRRRPRRERRSVKRRRPLRASLPVPLTRPRPGPTPQVQRVPPAQLQAAAREFGWP